MKLQIKLFLYPITSFTEIKKFGTQEQIDKYKTYMLEWYRNPTSNLFSEDCNPDLPSLYIIPQYDSYMSYHFYWSALDAFNYWCEVSDRIGEYYANLGK